MNHRFYVGTFNHHGHNPTGRDEGIYRCNFDSQTGKIVVEAAEKAGPDPAFLTMSSNGRFLYAVNETKEYQGHPGGGISALAVGANGELTLLNSQPTFGESPCYVSLDQSEKYALVSNYYGGSLAVYPILADGLLGPASDFIQHEGHGPNPTRQEKAHAHSIRMEPGNRVALAADLGLDKIFIYRLDRSSGELSLSDPSWIELHPGAGPRHLDFHPNGKWIYVINELDSTLSVFEVHFPGGPYRHLQTLSSLPDGYSGEKWAADIHIHPNGRWVIASNRAHDSLAVFAIDAQHGTVTLAGVTASGGKTPRNFAIDPSGGWVIAAHQDSDNLVVFRFDSESGQLAPVGGEISIPTPVCIKFVP